MREEGQQRRLNNELAWVLCLAFSQYSQEIFPHQHLAVVEEFDQLLNRGARVVIVGTEIKGVWAGRVEGIPGSITALPREIEASISRSRVSLSSVIATKAIPI